jgi:photosystem II stability/assembly factor-like uncharacterized protein
MGIGAVGSSGGVTWAVNSRGIWLTSDGGHSWLHSVPPDAVAESGYWGTTASMQFLDKQHGWIAAGNGVDRTTDGGRTWHQSIPGDCLGHCGSGRLSFVDARHGFLLELARRVNRLFRTSDGGRTWQLVSKPPIWGPIRFVNAKVGFAGVGVVLLGPIDPGPMATLYRTTDGGRTWSKDDIAGSNGLVEVPTSFFQGPAVVMKDAPSPGHGTINLNPERVWTSGDGGAHWTGRDLPAGVGQPAYFTATSPQAWALSGHDDVYLTADAGAHWRVVSFGGFLRDRSTRWIRQVAFTSSRAGWVVMWGKSEWQLFRTTDGGKHWTVAGPPKPKKAHTRG